MGYRADDKHNRSETLTNLGEALFVWHARVGTRGPDASSDICLSIKGSDDRCVKPRVNLEANM